MTRSILPILSSLLTFSTMNGTVLPMTNTSPRVDVVAAPVSVPAVAAALGDLGLASLSESPLPAGMVCWSVSFPGIHPDDLCDDLTFIALLDALSPIQGVVVQRFAGRVVHGSVR